MSQITVLLADDNGPMRELLANALRGHFRVHDPVSNGRQLVEAALVRRPDVIVSDVWMPVLGGLEAMRVLRELGHAMPFVMVSADSDIGPDCLAAGAAAFVCKADIDRQLVDAVAAAMNGAHHLPTPPGGPPLREETFVATPSPPIVRSNRIDTKA